MVGGQPAAIYCRVSSTRNEDQTGVDRQERLCREAAERLRLVIVARCVFVDNNRSAWQWFRKCPRSPDRAGAATHTAMTESPHTLGNAPTSASRHRSTCGP